jgi:type I restriction enzyme, R subunit
MHMEILNQIVQFEYSGILALRQEKNEVVKDMFHGFEYKKFFKLKPSERITFIPDAIEYILKDKGKKERLKER